MSKVSVFIEEHLCKEIIVDVPDGMDIDDAMDYAEKRVKEQYDNGDIVLTADDHNGIVLWMTEHENGISTNWRDM